MTKNYYSGNIIPCDDKISEDMVMKTEDNNYPDSSTVINSTELDVYEVPMAELRYLEEGRKGGWSTTRLQQRFFIKNKEEFSYEWRDVPIVSMTDEQ